MKKYVLASIYVFLCVIFLSLGAQAQLGAGGDVAFGISSVSATSSNNAGSDFSPQTIGGGVYPSFSGDFHLFHSIGVGGNVAWRATRNDYNTPFGTVPFRPIFYDFDLFFSPLSVPKVSPQVWAGIGAVSTRFYTGTINCSFTSCTNFQSVTHFLGDFGGGLKLKPKGNFFVRPEATVYLIRHNNEFSGPWAVRYGVSVGYAF